MNRRMLGIVIALAGIALVAVAVVGEGSGAQFWTGVVAGLAMAGLGAQMWRQG